MKVRRISDWELEERISGDSRPVVALFFRTGEFGQEVSRAELRRLADSAENARFYELDLLENPSLVERFDLKLGAPELRLPVTLVFVEGLEKARHVGSMLTRTVERALGSPRADRNGGA